MTASDNCDGFEFFPGLVCYTMVKGEVIIVCLFDFENSIVIKFCLATNFQVVETNQPKLQAILLKNFGVIQQIAAKIHFVFSETCLLFLKRKYLAARILTRSCEKT